MHTPTAALAWELWRRHRQRILLIAGILLGFILVYPKLCALVGFNLDSPDALEEMGHHFAPVAGQPTLLNVFKALYLLFLVGGPTLVMVLTLLCVIWMFAFTEMDPNTKDFLAFPARLFTLPVSTPFLFWRLVLGGLAAVLGLCTIWTHCVHLPQTQIFATYNNYYGWMTLLVLGQGITWALAAWPITRMLALMAVLFLFLVSPTRSDLVKSPVLLPPLFLLGVVLARAGLQKMRHGQWQGWAWTWPSANGISLVEWRAPKRFASPAQAQLWFEWRRSAARVCFLTAGLVLVPVAILAVRAIGWLPLTADNMDDFVLPLLGIPLIVFGLLGVSPTRTNQDFLLTRPLATGDMIMAMLKAPAIGALLSWVAVIVALGVMPWLGDFHALEQRISATPATWAALMIGLIFLTWRGAVVNLCFVLTGNRWVKQLPVLLLPAGFMCFAMYFTLNQNGAKFDWVWNHLSELAAVLVAVKFLLAYRAFREALKRRLLAPSAVTGYLVVWSLLVAALLATMLFLARPDNDLTLAASLGIVLLVPLARIGFAPFALAWARRHI